MGTNRALSGETLRGRTPLLLIDGVPIACCPRLNREGMEIRVAYLLWLLGFCRACWRRTCAWREQLLAIAGLGVLPVA